MKKTTLLSLITFFGLIPLTLFLFRSIGGKGYYLCVVALLVELMLPFFFSFEGRKPEARELTVLAVMCAICVAGRAAFGFIPHFSPITGLVIISAAAFGPESGFLVGAVSMLASNFIFGQSMYTPFQMFAFGITGFIAGLIFAKGRLPKDHFPMALFGALFYLFVTGPLLDTSVLLLAADASHYGWEIYLSGLPVNASQAVCTFITLWFLSRPMLEKLDRLKTKYGMMEAG